MEQAIIIIIIFAMNLISDYEKQVIPTRSFCKPHY